MKIDREFLLIVNPFSGKKQGITISKVVLKKLKLYSINPEIIYTEYVGHAEVIGKTLDSNLFSDILIIGGDGTFHELINGLLKREDHYKPCLGFIPGGSGNSLMHDLNLLDPIKAIKPIINKQYKHLDIMQIFWNDKIEYAINIIGWGVATDIAITAEHIRWLGPSRYTIASMYHILRFKKRSATVIINKEKINKKYFFVLACNTQYTGTGMRAAPNAQLDDGLFDVIILNCMIGRFELM